MNPISQQSPVSSPQIAAKTKVSVYLNPERQAIMNQLLKSEPSCSTLQDAIYQLIDWWGMQSGVKPTSLAQQDLSEIRRLLAQCAATQDALAQRTMETMTALSTALAGSLAPTSPPLTPVSDPASKSQLPRPIHRTLGAWLLDTLTRVSAHQASKVVAVLRPLPAADTSQQFMGAQLLSIEGLVLKEQYESAIDQQAFGILLPLDISTYLVCIKIGQSSWEAQVRTKTGPEQTSTVIWKQDIKH